MERPKGGSSHATRPVTWSLVWEACTDLTKNTQSCKCFQRGFYTVLNNESTLLHSALPLPAPLCFSSICNMFTLYYWVIECRLMGKNLLSIYSTYGILFYLHVCDINVCTFFVCLSALMCLKSNLKYKWCLFLNRRSWARHLVSVFLLISTIPIGQ